jgi:hypothetical protein
MSHELTYDDDLDAKVDDIRDEDLAGIAGGLDAELDMSICCAGTASSLSCPGCTASTFGCGGC